MLEKRAFLGALLKTATFSSDFLPICLLKDLNPCNNFSNSHFQERLSIKMKYKYQAHASDISRVIFRTLPPEPQKTLYNCFHSLFNMVLPGPSKLSVAPFCSTYALIAIFFFLQRQEYYAKY